VAPFHRDFQFLDMNLHSEPLDIGKFMAAFDRFLQNAH